MHIIRWEKIFHEVIDYESKLLQIWTSSFSRLLWMGISLLWDQSTNYQDNWYTMDYSKWSCVRQGVSVLSISLAWLWTDAETLNQSFAFSNGKHLFIMSLSALNQDEVNKVSSPVMNN